MWKIIEYEYEDGTKCYRVRKGFWYWIVKNYSDPPMPFTMYFTLNWHFPWGAYSIFSNVANFNTIEEAEAAMNEIKSDILRQTLKTTRTYYRGE